MKSISLRGLAEREKDVMKRTANIALTLCLASLGTGIQIRAADDCQGQRVRGTIAETIIPAPNDPNGRTLGIVTGVLKGASTSLVKTLSSDGLSATSFDVFVTEGGDMLTADGDVKLTPVSSSEFTENAILMITNGSGKYKGATGHIRLQGRAVFDSSGGGTFDVIYHGCISGPSLKADGN